MAKQHNPRSMAVATAITLLSICPPSWSQSDAARDPMIVRFLGFWRTVTTGPVLVAGKVAALQWEAPDQSGGGKARITRLDGAKLEAVQQGLAQAPKPLKIGERPGARVDGTTGPIVVWLHDDWCVQVIVVHHKTPASAAEVPGLEIATRLERVLSGQAATEDETPVADTGPTERPAASAGAAPGTGLNAERIALRVHLADGIQEVTDSFESAQVVTAVIDLGTLRAQDEVKVVCKRGNEELFAQPLPAEAGAARATVNLDMTGAGGFAPGAYELQVLVGGRLWASRRFVAGVEPGDTPRPMDVEVEPAKPLPAPTPEEVEAPEDIPGATVEGPAKPTVSGLELSLKVTADLRAVAPSTRFPATAPRIYALFDYSGFAAGATVRVVWTPKAGGQPTTVAVALKDTQGRGACYVAPKQGGTLAKGEWTVSVVVEGSAGPAASQRFTIE